MSATFAAMRARLEDNRVLEGLQKNDGRCVRHIIRLSPLTRDESGSLIQQLLKIENFRQGCANNFESRRGESVFSSKSFSVP